MKDYSVVIPEEFHLILKNHLIRKDGDEDLCFATYNSSRGYNRFSGILASVILPEEGDRIVQGNVSFSDSFLKRALQIARERGEGLVFLHSHPFPGWQSMSQDDVIAEKRIAGAALTFTGLPLLGMTIGNDESWSARFWHKAEKREFTRNFCSNVRVIGKKLAITFNQDLIPPVINKNKQLRTISAWGKKTQEDLSRIKIGIIGLGSVGSIVATNLARTGFSNVKFIDFDKLEEKNLDRSLMDEEDVGNFKVDAVKKIFTKSATAIETQTQAINYSICEERGYKEALDCDVLFSCVDRPWPRQILNFIAYAHLIPVIDGGILVRTNKTNTRLIGADWKVQTVGYDRPCLECLGQYRTDDAALEMEGKFDDPAYIKGLRGIDDIDVHENVFPFSMHLAAMEVLQLLNLVLSPSGFADVGQQMFHFVNGKMDIEKTESCCSNCYFSEIIGKGDSLDIVVYGKHTKAEEVRSD